GLSNSVFNGNYEVIDETATSFSYELIHADVTSTPDLGTASDPGRFTMLPKSTLPEIMNPVFINGTTQAGWAPNTSDPHYNANLPVVLGGSNLPFVSDGSNPELSEGLRIAGGNSTVEGLQIQNFVDGGIHLLTHGNDSILGNNIPYAGFGYGTPQSFGGGGVYIDGVAGNIIGGTTLDARNKFSYDDLPVHIAGAGASDNQVLGNVIGTDGTADQTSSGSFLGILINGASDNTIGGTAPGSKNVITGGPNGINAIEISG